MASLLLLRTASCQHGLSGAWQANYAYIHFGLETDMLRGLLSSLLVTGPSLVKRKYPSNMVWVEMIMWV
jgi:hypothetical protein